MKGYINKMSFVPSIINRCVKLLVWQGRGPLTYSVEIEQKFQQAEYIWSSTKDYRPDNGSHPAVSSDAYERFHIRQFFQHLTLKYHYMMRAQIYELHIAATAKMQRQMTGENELFIVSYNILWNFISSEA